MKSRRRALILIACGGLFAHAAVLAWWGPRDPGPLFSDVIQFLLGVAAAVTAGMAGRRSTRFSRQVWYLTSAALWIYTAGQGIVIYYDSIAHATLFSPWISDQFLFFWIVPLAVAALADPLDSPRVFDISMLLDVGQVLVIAMALHIAVFASPLNWQTQGAGMAFLEWKVRLVRDGLVLGALGLRATSTIFRQVRALFLRLSAFFLVYLVADAIYLYAEARWEVRAGTWLDLLWTLPRVLLIALALSWQCRDDEEFAWVPPVEMRRRVLLHVVPIVGPFLVLAVVTTLIAWAPVLALLLILASLVCTSLRLLVTQYRQEAAIGAVRVSEARYRSLFERNRAGVFRSSPGKGIQDCNEAFAQMLGYTREEMREVPSVAHYPGGKAERDARLAMIREKGQLTDYEICYRRKDGALIWAIQNVMLTRDENGDEVIEGTVVDITERHNLEEQLRQSQKMEAVGRLAGGVAHDFNNLLTVISGYSQLMEERVRQDPVMTSELKQIREAADRAAVLTRQLLAFSRRQVLQPQAISLNATLGNVEKLLRRLIGEDVELTTHYAEELWTVKADPGQIEQVAMNLAVNARDAMPDGGKLTFATENCGAGAEELREHPAMPIADYVKLTVSDTGCGMDAVTKAQIFEPFFTTKRLGEGTGLGLSTVYGIVKQSGGYVWVESAPGEGTSFRIYLPRTQAAPETATAPPAREARARGSERVLLVEDDERVRDFTSTVLKKNGYTVLEARDGGEAEAVSRKESSAIELLMTDVVLPDISGIVVAQRIREQRPAIRVLYISGYSPDTHSWQGSRVTDPVLQKPFSPAELAAEVRKLLDGSRTAAPRP